MAQVAISRTIAEVIRGEQGPVGPIGPTGPAGVQGLQGDTGRTGSFDWHDPVRVVSVGNVSIAAAGSRTIDGISLVSGDRVLLTGQTNPTENGIRQVQSNFSLTRPADADTGDELAAASVLVLEGSSKGFLYVCTTPAPINLGTTPITFTQVTIPFKDKLSLRGDFGAKFDGLPVIGSINSGTNVLSGSWPVSSDVGKVVLIPGALASGNALVSTINAVNPGVSVVLANNATASVSGVICMYGTDDTPAWDAAFARMYDLRGGTLDVSPPESPTPNSTQYSLVTRPINAGEAHAGNAIYHLKGCKIEGAGGGGSGAPCVVYLGGALAGPMFYMLSAFHCHFSGLFMMSANPSFDGDLVLFEKGLGGDASGCTVKYCGLGNAESNTQPNLRSYIRMSQVIYCHVEHCDIGENYAGSGVELGPGYVNVCTTERNTFTHNRNHVLISCGDLEAHSVRANVFEPTWGGQAGAIVGTENCVIYHSEIVGNWFGDIEWGGRSHLENLFADFEGSCEVHSNVFFSPGASHSITVTTTQAGGGGINEKQTVRVQGTTGSFTVTYAGQTTAGISIFATAAEFQSALVALSNIGPGDVNVTLQNGPLHNYPIVGRPVYYQWEVEFTGALANTNVAQMTATEGDLQGYGAFFNLGGGLWHIHSNRIAGSGTVLFDLTRTHGGTAGTPSLKFTYNRFAGGDIERMAANSFSGTPFTDLENNDIEIYGNRHSSTMKVPPTRNDRAAPATQGLSGARTLAPDFNWMVPQISGSTWTITIPPDSDHPDTPFWSGTAGDFIQGGAGVITFAPGAGVTLLSSGSKFKTNGANAVVTLKRLGPDLWSLEGDRTT